MKTDEEFVKRVYVGRIKWGGNVKGCQPVKQIKRVDKYWKQRELAS